MSYFANSRSMNNTSITSHPPSGLYAVQISAATSSCMTLRKYPYGHTVRVFTLSLVRTCFLGLPCARCSLTRTMLHSQCPGSACSRVMSGSAPDLIDRVHIPQIEHSPDGRHYQCMMPSFDTRLRNDAGLPTPPCTQHCMVALSGLVFIDRFRWDLCRSGGLESIATTDI